MGSWAQHWKGLQSESTRRSVGRDCFADQMRDLSCVLRHRAVYYVHAGGGSEDLSREHEVPGRRFQDRCRCERESVEQVQDAENGLVRGMLGENSMSYT